jgi:predicted nucleic acid-binding protein
MVVDTTVIIDIWRGRTNVRKCLEQYSDNSFAISSITIEEIYDGLRYTKKEKGEKLYEEIRDQFIKILHNFQIIPLSTEILKQTGLIRGELRLNGEILDLADIIIMVTAQETHASKIITRNPKHFKKSPIPIESYNV